MIPYGHAGFRKLILVALTLLSFGGLATDLRAGCYVTDQLGEAEWTESRRRSGVDANPVTFEQVQRVIDEHGIFTVVPGDRPSAEKVAIAEAMFGTPVIYGKDLGRGSAPNADPRRFWRLKGVALHPDDYVDLRIDHITGEINLHNVLKDPADLMTGKVAEIVYLRKYAPDSIPETHFYTLIVAGNPRLQGMRKNIRRMISDMSPATALRPAIEGYLAEFYTVVQKIFPEGAYFKLDGEFRTGDSDTLLTSFKTNPKDIADAFLNSWAQLRARVERGETTIEKVTEDFADEGHDNRKTDLMRRLLYATGEVLVQSKMDIAMTPLGYPYEIRLDVLGGLPMRPMMRHSWEYLPPEIGRAAQQFARDTIAKLPRDLQRGAAGYDVMMLKDGTFKLVETNAGSLSGTMMGDYNTVLANQAISELTGRNTDLMDYLFGVYKGDLAAQTALLKDPPTKHAALSDVHLLEKNRAALFAWLRDQYVNEYRANPSPALKATILRKLKALSEVVPVEKNDNFVDIYKSAEFAMSES